MMVRSDDPAHPLRRGSDDPVYVRKMKAAEGRKILERAEQQLNNLEHMLDDYETIMAELKAKLGRRGRR